MAPVESGTTESSVTTIISFFCVFLVFSFKTVEDRVVFGCAGGGGAMMFVLTVSNDGGMGEFEDRFCFLRGRNTCWYR